MTPKYVVYARSPKTALGNKSRCPFQGQSFPCGVMWEADPSLGSHFWVTCPAADDNTSEKNCPSGLHTHGVTAHEQEVMSKDARFSYPFPIDAEDVRFSLGMPYVRADCERFVAKHKQDPYLQVGSLAALAGTQRVGIHGFRHDPQGRAVSASRARR